MPCLLKGNCASLPLGKCVKWPVQKSPHFLHSLVTPAGVFDVVLSGDSDPPPPAPLQVPLSACVPGVRKGGWQVEV